MLDDAVAKAALMEVAKRARQMTTIQISGAVGELARNVNGLFELSTEDVNGLPVWKKTGEFS